MSIIYLSKMLRGVVSQWIACQTCDWSTVITSKPCQCSCLFPWAISITLIVQYWLVSVFFNFIDLLFGVLIDRQIFSSLTQNEVMLSLLNIILYIYRNCTISCLPGSIFKLYSKQSRDFLLYTKKEMNCVLFYDEIWLLLLHPE